MKRGTRIALCLLALAATCTLGTFLGYRLGCDPVLHEAACKGDAMSWLRHEYHLTAEQARKIEVVHRQYTASCDQHCLNIRLAVKARDEIAASRPGDTAALAAANEHIRLLSTNCEATIKEHLEEVSRLMSPEDGRRYLATMLPRLSKFDHSGAVGLGPTQTAQPHEHR